MLELEIRPVDEGELNFNKSFLQFNVKKKYMQRAALKEPSQFDRKY